MPSKSKQNRIHIRFRKFKLRNFPFKLNKHRITKKKFRQRNPYNQGFKILNTNAPSKSKQNHIKIQFRKLKLSKFPFKLNKHLITKKNTIQSAKSL